MPNSRRVFITKICRNGIPDPIWHYFGIKTLSTTTKLGIERFMQQGISEPIFYGDLVYKFKRIVGKPNFSDQFKKIVNVI